MHVRAVLLADAVGEHDARLEFSFLDVQPVPSVLRLNVRWRTLLGTVPPGDFEILSPINSSEFVQEPERAASLRWARSIGAEFYDIHGAYTPLDSRQAAQPLDLPHGLPSSAPREFDFTLCDWEPGTYSVWVVARNVNGLVQSTTVSFTIKPGNCSS